jgi:Acetyl-coenzyme A synthetase N-terminus
MTDVNIDALLSEGRTYPPQPEFAAEANAGPGIYDRGPDDFWTEEARSRVTWFTPFHTLKEWKPPYAKWNLGGELNVCYNCVDRHVEGGRGDRVAYYWEGEPSDERRTITYAQLQKEVVRFANTLKKLGVRRGVPTPPPSPIRTWWRRSAAALPRRPPPTSDLHCHPAQPAARGLTAPRAVRVPTGVSRSR